MSVAALKAKFQNASEVDFQAATSGRETANFRRSSVGIRHETMNEPPTQSKMNAEADVAAAEAWLQAMISGEAAAPTEEVVSPAAALQEDVQWLEDSDEEEPDSQCGQHVDEMEIEGDLSKSSENVTSDAAADPGHQQKWELQQAHGQQLGDNSNAVVNDTLDSNAGWDLAPARQDNSVRHTARLVPEIDPAATVTQQPDVATSYKRDNGTIVGDSKYDNRQDAIFSRSHAKAMLHKMVQEWSAEDVAQWAFHFVGVDKTCASKLMRHNIRGVHLPALGVHCISLELGHKDAIKLLSAATILTLPRQGCASRCMRTWDCFPQSDVLTTFSRLILVNRSWGVVRTVLCTLGLAAMLFFCVTAVLSLKSADNLKTEWSYNDRPLPVMIECRAVGGCTVSDTSVAFAHPACRELVEGGTCVTMATQEIATIQVCPPVTPLPGIGVVIHFGAPVNGDLGGAAISRHVEKDQDSMPADTAAALDNGQWLLDAWIERTCGLPFIDCLPSTNKWSVRASHAIDDANRVSDSCGADARGQSGSALLHIGSEVHVITSHVSLFDLCFTLLPLCGGCVALLTTCSACFDSSLLSLARWCRQRGQSGKYNEGDADTNLELHDLRLSATPIKSQARSSTANSTAPNWIPAGAGASTTSNVAALPVRRLTSSKKKGKKSVRPEQSPLGMLDLESFQIPDENDFMQSASKAAWSNNSITNSVASSLADRFDGVTLDTISEQRNANNIEQEELWGNKRSSGVANTISRGERKETALQTTAATVPTSKVVASHVSGDGNRVRGQISMLGGAAEMTNTGPKFGNSNADRPQPSSTHDHNVNQPVSTLLADWGDVEDDI